MSPTSVSVHSPCRESWSMMTPQSAGIRRCDRCNTGVHDFTCATLEEFNDARERVVGKFCGRFATDENGNILWATRWSKAEIIRAFVFSLLVCFNTSLFAFHDKQFEHSILEVQNELAIPTGEKAQIYVKIWKWKYPVHEKNVKITVNDQIAILAITDKRGRLVFELPAKMKVTKISFEIEDIGTQEYITDDYAADVSKTLIRIRFKRRFVSIGCPSF